MCAPSDNKTRKDFRIIGKRLVSVHVLLCWIGLVGYLSTMLKAFWYAELWEHSHIPKAFKLRSSIRPRLSSFQASRFRNCSFKQIFSIESVVPISPIRRSNKVRINGYRCIRLISWSTPVPVLSPTISRRTTLEPIHRKVLISSTTTNECCEQQRQVVDDQH